MIYIFVEGQDDERFFRHYYNYSDKVRIIEYSHTKKEKIQKFITSIAMLPSSDYIFTTDADDYQVLEKLDMIYQRYTIANKEKIVVCQMEIESWYLAGLTEAAKQELGIKKIYHRTEYLAKENFNAMIPYGFRRYQFMIEILKHFDKLEGTKNNVTFKYFYRNFNNILNNDKKDLTLPLVETVN
ncbi:MAG: hypothetical protein RBR48_04310 [Bacilli bacterium]|jgi:hypothetical protein|nr:hypothetical protein [Bacilli bacterium]